MSPSRTCSINPPLSCLCTLSLPLFHPLPTHMGRCVYPETPNRKQNLSSFKLTPKGCRQLRSLPTFKAFCSVFTLFDLPARQILEGGVEGEGGMMMITITKTLEKDTRRQWGNSWHLADVSCVSSCDLRRWLGGSKAIRTLGFSFLVSVRAW